MVVNGADRPRAQIAPGAAPPGGPAVSALDERSVLSLLRGWRWPIAAAVVVGAVASFVYASRLSPTYEASAMLLVGGLSTEPEAITSRTLTPTYMSLATSSRVLAAAIEASGVEMTVSELAERVRAEGVRTTRLVTIRVHDSDPVQAALLANAIASALEAVTTPAAQATPPPFPRDFVWRGRTYRQGELDAFVSEIGGAEQYRQWAALHPAQAAVLVRRPLTVEQERAERSARREHELALERTARIVEPADVPGAPIRPDVSRAVQYGATAALLAVLGLALLGPQTSSRVRVGADLAQAAGAPILGVADEAAAVGDAGPGARATSSYHRFVAALGLGGAPAAARSLVVVGADTDVAMVVVNLAGAVADHGARVALVTAGPDAPIGPGRIHAADPNPEGARELLERLLADADVVVVCASTLDQSPAALIWAPLADRTLLVARRRRTRMRTVARTVSALRDVGVDVAGTILRR